MPMTPISEMPNPRYRRAAALLFMCELMSSGKPLATHMGTLRPELALRFGDELTVAIWVQVDVGNLYVAYLRVEHPGWTKNEIVQHLAAHGEGLMQHGPTKEPTTRLGKKILDLIVHLQQATKWEARETGLGPSWSCRIPVTADLDRLRGSIAAFAFLFYPWFGLTPASQLLAEGMGSATPFDVVFSPESPLGLHAYPWHELFEEIDAETGIKLSQETVVFRDQPRSIRIAEDSVEEIMRWSQEGAELANEYGLLVDCLEDKHRETFDLLYDLAQEQGAEHGEAWFRALVAICEGLVIPKIAIDREDYITKKGKTFRCVDRLSEEEQERGTEDLAKSLGLASWWGKIVEEEDR